MNSEIKSTLESIVIVLSQNDELLWANLFENIIQQVDTDYLTALMGIKSVYGGAGTFNDLVIHKDGWPPRQENVVLDDLRTHLYKLTVAELGNIRQR